MTLEVRVVLLTLLVVNIVSFLIMAYDKYAATHKMKRISEAHLFYFALMGAATGSFVAMHFLHHKTKHSLFVVGMPLLVIIQGLLVNWFMVFAGSL